jgi:ketosteroid isomerase-like protein
MSPDNVELAWRAVDAFNRALAGESEEFFDLVSDDVEWAPITTLLDGVSYRGLAAVRDWVADLRRDWDFYELEWEEVRYRDGLAIRVQTFTNRDDALEAARLG